MINELTYCFTQGPRSPLKSEGAQGGTFFRATFYCGFGRFGKMTYLANLKKWGAQAPPLCPPSYAAPDHSGKSLGEKTYQ